VLARKTLLQERHHGFLINRNENRTKKLLPVLMRNGTIIFLGVDSKVLW
jgi:hypothetical protein